MGGLLSLIFVASLVGIFRPYLNGVTRMHFALTAFVALLGIGFSASQPGVATSTQPTNAKPTQPLLTPVEKAIAGENPSAFERKAFDRVSISLPRNWRWIGESDAQALNTNSEALTESLGVGVGQGNNTILIAGNAFNDARVSVATVRLSVRSGPTIGQAELQDALKEPQEPINREIREVAEKTAVAMRKLPQMQFYSVTGGGLRQNGSMVCMWTAFEYDLGKGATASDSWVCPSADRTFKLTTSYAKSHANLYAATVDYVWRSIRLEPVS